MNIFKLIFKVVKVVVYFLIAKESKKEIEK